MSNKRKEVSYPVISLKEVINGGICRFDRFQNNTFFYNVNFRSQGDEVSYQFPIVQARVEGRTMLSIEKIKDFLPFVREAIDNDKIKKNW